MKSPFLFDAQSPQGGAPQLSVDLETPLTLDISPITIVKLELYICTNLAFTNVKGTTELTSVALQKPHAVALSLVEASAVAQNVALGAAGTAGTWQMGQKMLSNSARHVLRSATRCTVNTFNDFLYLYISLYISLLFSIYIDIYNIYIPEEVSTTER